VELRLGQAFFRRLGRLPSSTKRILSRHDYRRTPGLTPIYERMRALRPEVIKIATMAEDISDAGRMVELWRRARSERQPLIGICMGERGEITRILGGIWGCLLTFGAPEAGAATGPGQRTVDDLHNVFRVHTLGRQTKVFGLIGNPVSHSRGIFFHNAAFHRRRINAVYVNCLVDQIPSFFRTVAGGFSGFSVTMPHKQSVIPLLDSLDDASRTLGSVNTVIRRRGSWKGSNTDFPALEQLLTSAGGVRGKKVVILGAGGTARTMACAALRGGADVTVAGRTPGRARALAGELGCSWCRLDEVEEHACDVLMNATPVGMAGTGRSMLCSASFLRRCSIVMDAVYAPEMTPLLENARRQGCRIIKGIDLFRAQARLQSRLFIEACA
jgi:3-dehydroquinate dehydratase/shikimate dehydrogenase